MKSRKDQIILDTAYEMFKRDGYAALSCLKVARAAKVSRALVHYYFKSRRNLKHILLNKAVRNRDMKVIAQAMALGDTDLKAPEYLKSEARKHL